MSKDQLYSPQSKGTLDNNVGDGIEVWQEKKYLKYGWVDLGRLVSVEEDERYQQQVEKNDSLNDVCGGVCVWLAQTQDTQHHHTE